MRRVSRGSSVSPSSAGGWGASRAGGVNRSHRLGLLTGVGLIVGGAWAVAVAQAGGNVSGPGIVLAIAMSMLVAWTWQLGTMLAPGMARPVDVFALPGISSGAWSPNIPPGLAPRRTARPTAGADSPTRFDIHDLARRTGLTLEELRAAQPAYRRVTVPKRSGGERLLLVPDDATKALQRRLLRRVLARVPVHPAAHGFERGRSIVSNATPHVGRAVVVRMDVIEFFGSTSARRIRRLFRVLGWDAETAELLTRLTTHDGGLPTGAPTSPRLANLVNVLLDARLTGLAEALGAPLHPLCRRLDVLVRARRPRRPGRPARGDAADRPRPQGTGSTWSASSRSAADTTDRP